MVIIEQVNQIFIRHLHIDFIQNENLWQTPFFSTKLNIEPRELVLVLLELERELNIKISDDFIEKGDFKNFKSIIDYIGIHL